MKTDVIASIDNLLGKLDAWSQSHPKQLETPTRRISTSHGRDVVSTSTLNYVQIDEIDRSNAKMHAFAYEVRKINDTLDTIEANLGLMHAALEGIVKIYPPYPIGSTEREEALQQFSTFRDMIERLTIPPAQDLADRATIDPAGSSKPEDGLDTREEPAMVLKFRLQSLSAAEKGLDIPEVSADISDEQLSQVMKRTAGAQETLMRKRQEFNNDVKRAIGWMNLG